MTHNLSRSRHGRLGTDSVIYTNDHKFSFDPYGSMLPSMVKVALTVGNIDVSHISCRLDPNGWAWLVCGRKLYVWKYSLDQSKKTSIACRELTLPPSELVHSANLICIVSNSISSNPSCIAVNPEGHITYWPNITNGSSTVTVNADIPGQECDSLTSVWPFGCLLTTTSCTVLLVKPMPAPGNKPSLTCVPLGMQKGWFDGLKKMQTMLFTPLPALSSSLETKRAKVVVPLIKEDDPYNPGKNREGKLFISCGTSLQTWQINSDGINCLLEFNMHDTVKLQFYNNVWATEEESRADVRGIQVWILDVAALPQTKQIVLFAAAKGQFESSDNLVYGLVVFDAKNPKRQDSISFIKVDRIVGAHNEDHLFVWKLLCTPDYFLMVSNDLVVVANDSEDEAICDSTDSGSFSGPIIGHGFLSPSVALVFLSKLGIYSVKPTGVFNQTIGLDDTFAEIRVPDHLALSITQPSSIVDNSTSDEVNRYKSAMVNYVNRKIDDALLTLAGLFPSNVPSLAPHDPLDKSTVALCEKLVDDAPLSDPRWMANFGRHGEQDIMGLKSKILIKNFLTDKKEGLELFFGFLNGAKLWPRLKGIIVKEDVIATGSILYNCYEKIGFALALQNLQTEVLHRKLIDTAIKSIVYMRSETESQVRGSHLSHNDVFYKDISRIQHIIPALISIEEEDLSNMSPKEMPSRIFQTNEIILRAYFEANSVFLADKLQMVRTFLLQPLLETAGNEYEVYPWLVQSNVLSTLMKQHQIIVNSGIRNTEANFGKKIDLIKQLVQYTDLILDGLKTNAESVHQSARYRPKYMNFEKIRGNLLRAHLSVQDYDGAGSLAEKYLDFEMLVTICYEKKNMEQLEIYFAKYESMNFPEFTFEWYVKQKKTAELINAFSSSQFSVKLGEFVKKYPQLAWHHAAVIENFQQASDILSDLADAEEVSADDKKFFLCMSKLSALANAERADPMEQSEKLSKLNKNLALMEFQNTLPDQILKNFSLTRETMRVLTSSDLIDMYTSNEVPTDVENFWQAKQLIDFMANDAVKREKLLLIISRLILRDPWDTWSTDHPMDSIQCSQLYQFLVLGLERGETLESLFPLAELATVDELRPFFENASVTFLLRACHEHLATIVTQSMEMDAED
ncbi:hypothetical protein Ocin01_01707 [Orchesella cincta]|uniref:Nuclear pore complex protein n=1 Tax=Orchesella cincta TaxID=48709 RepID=A0A1D2NI87_ORCCI|nr:hypothetical protein Ocin01_01707 [Orchesella cincta]